MLGLKKRSNIAPILAALAVLSGCVSAQKSNVSVDFYSISGNSTAALDREIKRKGPRISGGRHAVAIARIKILPSVEYEQIGDKCKVNSARVSVDAKVTLPKWTGRRRATKQLGETWDNIDRYTRLHEAMHVAIAFRFARDMEAKLAALKEYTNCRAIKQATRKIIEDQLQEHDTTQKQFDADEQRRFSLIADKRRNLGEVKVN